MLAARCACSLLVLQAAVTIFGFGDQHSLLNLRYKPPAKYDDTIVFTTTNSHRLICQVEKEIAWEGSDGDEVAYKLVLPRKVPYNAGRYVCRFPVENNANATKLFEDSIPRFTEVFMPYEYISDGDFWELIFNENSLICLSDSDLPDHYFHLFVQRPFEEKTLKCRVRYGNGTLYLRFQGYPTVICDVEVPKFPPSVYGFNLPGIVDNPFTCAFLPYLYLRLGNTATEERLHQSLMQSFPVKSDGHHKFTCAPHASTEEPSHFQMQLSDGRFYDCRLLDYPVASKQTRLFIH